MSDLQTVIKQAKAANLTTVYYYASAMVAVGRFTLVAYDDLPPQVNVNPASVAALVAACKAVGIDCRELTPKVVVKSRI